MADFVFNNEKGIFNETDKSQIPNFNVKVRVRMPRLLEWRRESMSNPIRILCKEFLVNKYKGYEHPENIENGIDDKLNLNRINTADVYICDDVSGPRTVQQESKLLVILNNKFFSTLTLKYYQEMINDGIVEMRTTYTINDEKDSWTIQYEQKYDSFDDDYAHHQSHFLD